MSQVAIARACPAAVRARPGAADSGVRGRLALERAIIHLERRREELRQLLSDPAAAPGHDPGFARLMLHLAENALAELHECHGRLRADERQGDRQAA